MQQTAWVLSNQACIAFLFVAKVVYLQLSFGIKCEKVTPILIVANSAALADVLHASRREVRQRSLVAVVSEESLSGGL